MYVTLGMRLLCKNISKSKLVYVSITCTFFCCTFISIVNVKLKLWDYNEKSKGFHLASEFILLQLEPWGDETSPVKFKIL